MKDNLIEKIETAASTTESVETNTDWLSDSISDDDYVEEDIMCEVNDVSILASSRFSLAHSHLHTNNNQLPSLIDKKWTSAEEVVAVSVDPTKLSRFRRFKERLPLKGYFYALLCALSTTFMTILLKLSTTLTGADATAVRYALQFLIMFILTRKKKLSPFGPRKQRKLLIFRAFAGTCALTTFFFGFKLIDPSDCLALMHASVIITSILARIFLKEKLTLAHIVSLVLTATGIFLISKPKSIINTISHITFDETILVTANNSSGFNNSVPTKATTVSTASHFFSANFYITLGIVLSLLSALSNGVVQVMLKKLCIRKVHYSIVTIYTTYIGFPVSVCISVILILTGASHANFTEELKVLPLHICYAVLASVFGVLGQVFLNLAMNHEDASRVSIVKSMDVFFTFALQYIVLNIPIDIYSILGSIAILSGTLLVLAFKIFSDNMNSKIGGETSDDENKQFWFVQIIKMKL